MLLKRPLRLSRRHPLSLLLLLLLLMNPALLSAQNITETPSTDFRAQSVQQRFTTPSLGDLPRDLVKNTLRLFSKDNLLPLAIGTGAALAVHPADDDVRSYFDKPRLGRAGDVFGAKMGNGAAVAAAVGTVWAISRHRGDEKFSRFSYDLAQASALNTILTTGLKLGFDRERPNGHSMSFPSGHTSSAFAAAAVIDHHYGWKTSLAGYAAATFIGFSRIDSQKHHLSDVVAGATLGYIVGRTVTRKDNEDQRWQLTPLVSPSSRSVGVHVSFDLGK